MRLFRRRCRHRRARILDAYASTERNVHDYWTADGQRIPAAIYVCKLRCDCGHAWLNEVLLSRLAQETG